MKLVTIATSLAVASLAIVSNAYSLNGINIFKRDMLNCPVNVLSCSPESSDVHSCCLPKMGLLVLTQQWIPGYGPPTEFTLHGLWPDTCEGGWGPKDGCDKSRAYKDIETRLNNYPGGPSLVKDLHIYWPSYMGDNNKFWAYEWKKHGTCVSNIAPSCMPDKPMNHDLYVYFKKALELRSQYNLYQALEGVGILPGSNPHVLAMQNAIKAKFGVNTEIDCKNGVLKEIKLYFKVKNGFGDFVPVDPLDYAPSTTSAPGAIPTGIQKGDCSINDATVCVEPGVSNQYSKCVMGKWILNQCKSGQVCYSDSHTKTHCM
ncbi:ribonuclease T2-like [Actinomortierella wolfii]|nr:ribonuclease T2-like [Actinomortierella wolfii]